MSGVLLSGSIVSLTKPEESFPPALPLSFVSVRDPDYPFTAGQQLPTFTNLRRLLAISASRCSVPMSVASRSVILYRGKNRFR